MLDPQTMFRAAVQPVSSGKMLLQVRIGDLFEMREFDPPSLLVGGDPSWQKGAAREALDGIVLSMCRKILVHGSIFKHREDCTLSVPVMQPCPQCQGPKVVTE